MKHEKYSKVAVGGTFDHFHHGHQELLTRALQIACKLLVGVTSQDFAASKNNVETCQTRMASLEKFLEKFNLPYHIEELNDSYGTAIDDETIDAIVVSEETKPTALKINKIRTEKGMNPLKIISIDMVLADDGNPISSTRIREGRIDAKGRILKKN